MIKLPFDLPAFESGQVWLVGAGPGDPGLLTLSALHALQEADVVVHDALVDTPVMALVNPKAELIYAGKRGGRPSAKQPDISAKLVELAKAGKRVLRLKGGDPFVFGRGAEEARELVEAGVPFRVVPGVTAGVAGPAYAGIPVTSRETNSAITFVTGHSATGELPDDLDWTALAKGSPVLVIYMGLKHLPLIVEKLQGSGRASDEPVVVISEATTPRQKVLESNLETLVGDVKRAGMSPPALVVVGQVNTWRTLLDWWSPLASAKPNTLSQPTKSDQNP